MPGIRGLPPEGRHRRLQEAGRISSGKARRRSWQAGGRAAISFERVAINLVDARIADNAGAQPRDEQVVDGAPCAYFSTLPVKAMVELYERGEA